MEMPIGTRIGPARGPARGQGASRLVLPFAFALLLPGQAMGGPTPSLEEGSGLSLRVDRDLDLGSGEVLSNYIAVQGAPSDALDPFEAEAWQRLGLRSAIPLFNEEDYWPAGGIRVIRSEERPGAQARGPLGPSGDLWLDVSPFLAQRQEMQTQLGMRDDQLDLSIDMMPRTLSYNGASEEWMKMSPADPEEWSAVVRESATFLQEIGLVDPTFFFFGEYENLFLGKNRPLESRERARDHAALYILTQTVLRGVLPNARVAGPATSTYAQAMTADLQQNPEALGIEDWLASLKEIDPEFEPSAVSWQGYYWYGLDGYGPRRLLEGADHIRGVLRDLGFRDSIPQYLDGWNGTFGNPQAADGEVPPQQRASFQRSLLHKEAAHLGSSILEWLDLEGGGERRIHAANYFTWNLDGTPECGIFSRQSIVSTVHPEGDLGDPNPECFMPASKVACKRETYFALELLADMRQGTFVSTAVEDPTSVVRAAAVKKGGDTEVLIVHRDGGALPRHRIRIEGLDPGRTYRVTFESIRSRRDLCARLSVSRPRWVRAGSDGGMSIAVPAERGGILKVKVRAN